MLLFLCLSFPCELGQQPIRAPPSGWNSGAWISANQFIPLESRLEADAVGYVVSDPSCLISRGVSAAKPAPPFIGMEPSSLTAGMKAKPITAPLPAKGSPSSSDSLMEGKAKLQESQTDTEKIDARLVTLGNFLNIFSYTVICITFLFGDAACYPVS